MKHIFIGLLAIMGIVWKVDLGARVYVDWAVVVMFAAFMFTMGDRFDRALRRWELRPRWRKVRLDEAETLLIR